MSIQFNQQKQEMHHKKNILYYIYCALGEKSGKNNKDADTVAFIRLLMFLSILITNSFIVINALHNLTTPKCCLNYAEISNCRKS